MGLDQYAYRRGSKIETAVDFEQEGTDELIYQWRKHANLQDWMESLYWEKVARKNSTAPTSS